VLSPRNKLKSREERAARMPKEKRDNLKMGFLQRKARKEKTG